MNAIKGGNEGKNTEIYTEYEKKRAKLYSVAQFIHRMLFTKQSFIDFVLYSPLTIIFSLCAIFALII